MEYDIIIGAGPSGISAAIRLAQLANQHLHPLRICVLEKGAEVGAHILSGAILEPRALNKLIPHWQTLNAPITTMATLDEFLFLTQKRKFKLPTPPQMRNQGNYIISLGKLCRWLAKQAEALGVEIFPGFAAVDALWNAAGEVQGVITNDVGIHKNGEHKANFQPGTALKARFTLLAEGCRGSLTKQLNNHFQLQANSDPQPYGIGLKELWEIPAHQHQLGKVTHTIGWPLKNDTYGGAFIYHFEPNLISIGFVVGLDYKNPFLDPYQEFQRVKQHPTIRSLLEGGNRIAYSARTLNEGGLHSIPKLTFPGGLLIGCAAGFLNVPKIKGSHTAMKSGMIAADTVFRTFLNSDNLHSSISSNPITSINSENVHNAKLELSEYKTSIRSSWIWEELTLARNIRPAFQWGLWKGLANAALDTYIFRGKAPWTLHHHRADHLSLKKGNYSKKIVYPKPDGKISFDKLTFVQFSNTFHENDQPSHLKVKHSNILITTHLELYDAPEQRYCPLGVYEIVYDAEKNPHLQINSQNCIHCKACDIKDPLQNINWVPPEGGGGPHYYDM